MSSTDCPRAAAARSIIWLVALNKPFYPLYVWWLAGHGLAAAWSIVSALAFLALLGPGRRDDLWLRAGLPLVGAIDTVAETALFGAASGTGLFLVPCLLIAALALRPDERVARWIAVGVVAAAALPVARGFAAPLGPWSAAEQAALFSLNLYSVIALCAFVIWRFDAAAPADHVDLRPPRA